MLKLADSLDFHSTSPEQRAAFPDVERCHARVHRADGPLALATGFGRQDDACQIYRDSANLRCLSAPGWR